MEKIKCPQCTYGKTYSYGSQWEICGPAKIKSITKKDNEIYYFLYENKQEIPEEKHCFKNKKEAVKFQKSKQNNN